MMRDLLGSIGIIEKSKPPITYRERAPLVLPPRSDLPPPVEPGDVARANAQWPNDPDIAARRARAAAERTPETETETRRMNGPNSRLTVQELRAGTRADAPAPNGPVNGPKERDWVHPDVLRAQSHPLPDEAETPGGEPERRALVQPPPGYRRSANGEKIKSESAPAVRRSQIEEESPYAFFNKKSFGGDE